MEPDIKITIPVRNYSLDAILATCSELASANTTFLLQKNGSEKSIDVLLTTGVDGSKKSKKSDSLKALVEKFEASLLENQIRCSVMTKNMDIREQIVYNALSNPVFFDETSLDDEIPESIAKILEEDEEKSDESYIDDPLNIAVPWEERNKP